MTTLKAIPLTQDDINLITYALRILSKQTAFSNVKKDTLDLIRYIESENKKESQ